MVEKNYITTGAEVRGAIRELINSGTFAAGTAIPSENDLASVYGIDRYVVRGALDALVEEGTLMRVKGKGAYVCGPKIERDLETLEGFTQQMKEKKIGASKTVLIKTLRKAGGKYAETFDITPDSEIFYIKRLCEANGEPGFLEEIYIPKWVCPKLEGIDLRIFSLYEVYGFYGIEPRWATQTLDLTTVEQSDARILGVSKKQTLLLLSCITYDDHDRPIEYSRAYTRPDKYSFIVHFKRE
jgi:GntR family transcriptional regulator